ncbi:type II secretion system protein [Bizionia argentinensis JUB59]|uniref:Type II secretion system protein n=1 Tax=Bizionia argentinensis JUB59 TaxID=1046627 RepID=G2EH00_9FLAO|nr:prepilin-type N-terminal cleavage/methylation domain-containing protein [Bizionia argentinensis]EGV42228.2 type II secretion system protein [Bizionia argentinensis JUB59]
MKKLNSKIKAFTLSEMIVVLILSSIVIGLAFSVLNLVQKHMISIQQNYTNTTKFKKLETSLWLDFNRYSKIEYSSLENELKFSTAIDSVMYQFSDNYIIKGIDTFPVPIQQKQFYFDGEFMEHGQIDAIKLETEKTFQNQQLFIFKNNDANAYMN